MWDLAGTLERVLLSAAFFGPTPEPVIPLQHQNLTPVRVQLVHWHFVLDLSSGLSCPASPGLLR